jgi:ribose 5-phosphate isomerase B
VKNKKIVIAADHAGYYLKEKLKTFLKNENIEVNDLGTDSPDNVDYPDFGHPLAKLVAEGEADMGITICGTGNGMNMTVNKHPGIRGALCWNEEMSRLARAHNDANICALPGRFINESEAYLIVRTFINTPFDGGRHLRRIEKIPVKTY